MKFGIIDGAIKEPVGGAHHNYELMCDEMKKTIVDSIEELSKLSPEELKRERYNKYRRMGAFVQG